MAQAEESSSASNAWVESYLNALLSFGLSSEYAGATAETANSKAADLDRSLYSKYYVTSLLKLNEDALKNAWSKAASATRHGGEKDARLQYLSWRIWHLKRRYAEVERARRAAAEEEGPSVEVSSDEEGAAPPPRPLRSAPAPAAASAPDLAPAPAVEEPVAPPLRKITVKMSEGAPRTAEALDIDALFEDYMLSPHNEAAPHGVEPPRLDRLYVVMISLHGLVRGEHMELGKDSDTGGQVKYVVELARAMSLHPAVHRVDLLTRLIRDPSVASDYGVEEECIAKGRGERGGAYIVRLPCGPTHRYVHKELLWPYVREFADRGIAHVSATLGALAEAGRRCDLYCVHGHYADAGEAAVLMCHALDVPLVVTGHSLGRNKLEHLLTSASMTRAEIEATYSIGRRIEAEECCLDAAAMVFTSTQQEVDEQWGLYDGYSPELARVLRFRRSYGRHMPLMKVSPPGLDFSSLKVTMPEDPTLKEFEAQRAALAEIDLAPLSPTSAPGSSPSAAAAQLPPADSSTAASSSAVSSPTGKSAAAGGSSPTAVVPQDPGQLAQGTRASNILPNRAPIWQDIARYLRNPLKPAVLAMSRPDAKKNITTLVKAFGEHAMLRELANLVLIMGNRDNIDSMASGSQKVLVQVLKMIDAYDLYGSVSYPKHHTQGDISDIYLFAAETRGVFVNIALQEPFGLTVIEAAAHGVPTVATRNGGPVDIMRTLHHGVVVDPTDSDAVAAALLGILTKPSTWDAMSSSGINNIMAYSWPAHCKRYMEAMDAEKRFVRSYRRQDRTMSGLLEKRLSRMDLLSMDTDALPSPKLAEPPAAETLQRHFSTPGALTPPLMVSAPQSPAPGRRPSGVSNDDLTVLQSLQAEAVARHALRESAATRDRFITFHIDSDVCVPAVARAMRAVQDALGPYDAEAAVGLGALSMLGFDSTLNSLRDAGVDMDGVDFLVCNSGADVWMRREGGRWEADEAWEGCIEFEWDRISMHRMLQKIISAPAANHRRLPRLKELLYNVGEAPEAGVHPRHICLELDPETQAILATGMGPKARQAGGVALAGTVAERLKRRLRSKGLRAQFTLQLVPRSGATPGGGDEDFLAVLHITPLRASRALALRFLSHRLGLDMAACSVVALAPELQGQGLADGVIGAFTSDTADLVGGMQRVYVLRAGQVEGLPEGRAGALTRHMAVPLAPWEDVDRVAVVEEAALAQTVVDDIKKADDGA